MELTIELKNSAEITIATARKLITDGGGLLIGDDTNGEFTIRGVVGTYIINGSTITINITDKPFLLPKTYIKTKIYEFFK